MVTNKGASANLECKSTDVKPTTGVDVNTKIHELDTDKWYYFTGETWAEIPNSGGGGGFTPTEQQLTAMNSGITGEDVEQIGTNETNILKDTAALVEVIDSGAKNVIHIPDSFTLQDADRTSATINADGTITVNVLSTLPGSRTITYMVTIPSGTYHFSCGENSGTGDNSNYDCYISDTSTSPATTLIRDNDDAAPGTEATISAGTYRVTIRMRTPATVGAYTFKPMLCSIAAWNISQAYQPYRPSYQELYDRVVALEQAN